jgi:hypothetical protein
MISPEALHHCERVHKHENTTGFARVEAEKGTPLQLCETFSLKRAKWTLSEPKLRTTYNAVLHQ